MKQVRAVATGLFYLTRIVAVPYLLSGAYALIAIVFRTASFDLVEHGRFVIFYPFTREPFLIGDENTTFYKTELVAFLLLYGVFFWSLGNIFLTFRGRRIFTPKGVQRLKIFYWLNFTVPALFLVVHLGISYEVMLMIGLTMLHVTLGVFAYFMAAIFSQGLNLQDEQDLIF